MYPCNEWVQTDLWIMYPCKECEKSEKDWVQTGLLIMYPCSKEIEKSCTYL